MLERAVQQIHDRRYSAELEAAGIARIIRLAVAFRGKEFWVKDASLTIHRSGYDSTSAKRGQVITTPDTRTSYPPSGVTKDDA